MAKDYKNVYTILEKVKKGEIKSYYKEDDGLFGKINFYKKPDLIKPHMHWLDEQKIDNIMHLYLWEEKTVKEVFNKFASSADYKKLQPSSGGGGQHQPNFSEFHTKVRQKYNTFPKHMVKDIFKMFYHKMDRLEFEERIDVNYTKYKFLEKANNPVAKIMSEGSNLKSAIFARNIVGYYIMRTVMMDYVDPDNSQQIQNGLDGNDSDFDSNAADEALNKMFDTVQSKNLMEDALNKASDLCKKMDNTMDQELQEEIFDDARWGAGEAGKISSDYFDNIVQSLEKVSLSMGSVKEKIKKLLDKSVNYFSAKKETTYEDLFNSDNVSGLEDFELLHPKLRKLFIEDLQVKDTKSIGKIDVYVDISGSMSSGCGITNEKGNGVSKLDFAKAFVSKLRSMDMLNEVYSFNTKVKKLKNDPISIALMKEDGGTTINNAMKSIIENNVNALIITDAEDRCDIYSDKAFFIGVKGACFHHFNAPTIEQYSEKNQVVVFDGTTIYNVDKDGHV